MTFFRDILRHLSLISPIAFYLAWGLVGIAFAIGLFVSLRQRRIRAFIALAIAAVIDFIATFVFEVWPNPFPDEVPIHLFLAGFPMLFLTAGTILVSKRRAIMCVLMLFSLLGLLIVVNFEYRQYSSLASLLPDNNVKKMSYHDFLAQKKVPRVEGRPVGALVTVSMPGKISGFKPRDALAYIPPAYWTKPQVKLPVVIMIPGSPGRPIAWFNSAKVNDTADEYQREHGGVSPIAIAVDGTGSLLAEPNCVDRPGAKVQTYLSIDVPDLVKQRFRVNPDQKKWTLAGLSYGGTCTMQIIANSPGSYGSFLDFSGQAHLIIKDLKTTVDELFDGDMAAFRRVNARDVFKRAVTKKSSKYRSIAGKFICGAGDKRSRAAQNMMAPLVRKVGMKVDTAVIPGGHNYDVWRRAMKQSFDFVATRGGLS